MGTASTTNQEKDMCPHARIFGKGKRNPDSWRQRVAVRELMGALLENRQFIWRICQPLLITVPGTYQK